MEATKLVGTGRTGDMVHQGQIMGTDQGFGKVSKPWLNRCMPIDDGIQAMIQAQRQIKDYLLPVEQVVPTVTQDGCFAMLIDGIEYKPTEYALEKLAFWGQSSSWYFKSLIGPSCDRGDANALVVAVKNAFRHIVKGKVFTWRTWNDGTLRAMMSDQYACVNNEWYLTNIAKLIPGGMLSHWRSNADTIFGNVLIPDTIREEDDSDYGGLISLSNCEIGTRRIDLTPALFRAICMNGCIWDRVDGIGIRKRHRGEINLDHLLADMASNVHKQIPLAAKHLEIFLSTKKMETNINMNPVLAAVCDEFKINQFGPKVLTGYQTEVRQTNINPQSLFAVINGLTRASQLLLPHDAVNVDVAAGDLSRFDAKEWGYLTTRAASMKVEKVDSILGLAV